MLFGYSKSDNSHRNQCSHTSVIPWVLASGDLAVIGCSVTLRLLRDCRDLSVIRLMRLFSLFLGEGPARGAPGPVRFLCTLLWCLRGDLAPPGAGSGSAPCAPVQTTYPLQVTCRHKSWGRPSLPSIPPSSYGEIRLLARQYPLAAFHFSLAAGPPILLQVS